MNTRKANLAIERLRLATTCLKSAASRREQGQVEYIRDLTNELNWAVDELQEAIQEPDRQWWQVWRKR